MQARRHRWAISAMFLLNGFSYGNWISRLPRFQEIYGLDNGGIGLVLLSHAVGALIAMPFTGFIIARIGSRKASIIAAWTFLFWIGLIPLASNAFLFGAIFFGMGISSGMMDVSMNAQAVLAEKMYKRPIMTSFHAIFSMGMMLGAGFGALFIRFGLDIMPHIYTNLVLGILLAWYATPNLVIDRLKNATAEGGGFQLPNRALLGMGMIAFCCMLGEGAMADWTTNYLENIASAAPATAPLGLASFSMAMMIARFLGDGARARWGDGRLLITGSILAALGLAIILTILKPIVIIIACMLVGLGLSVIVPIAYSKAGNMPNIEPGVGISMVTTVGYSGFLFGPPIIGFVADGVGLRLALSMVLGLFLLMLFLSTKVPRTPRSSLRTEINS